jgi:hypothetical protein
VGSFDRPGQPDEPERPEDHGKSGGDSADRSGQVDRPGHADRPRAPRESESERAGRLGLSTLTREDAWRSQRAEADAQEAALERRDSAASRESADPAAPANEADTSARASREASEPELGPDRDAPGRGADHWNLHRPEGQPEANIDAAGRYYWTEVPRFLAMWREHCDEWPGPRSHEAESSLDPEQRARTAESVRKIPDVEPPISGDVRQVEAENAHGGWLEGYDFRLKGQDRLTEKIADALETSSPDATPEEIVRQIPDAIRYTFCFRTATYTDGYQDVKNRLESYGHEMYYSKNSWTDPEYKGINTRWVTPEGQRFEVQFHTRESFHAKHQVTHEAYERIRNPLTADSERRALSSFQREVSSWIPSPRGVTGIPNVKKEGF